MTGRASLERFVPRVAAEWDLDGPGGRHKQIDGTLCFVDISGFTNLSEKLARRGRIGAEELTDVLDRVFGEMLRLAYDRGGNLLKFGGDALLLMFEGSDHGRQAACAAVEMRAALRQATRIPTSVGRIELRMSVGVHSGPIDLYLVGDSHRELVVTGETATVTTEMEGAADAGEILVSPRLAAMLGEEAVGDAKGPGRLLRWRRATAEPVGVLHRRPVDRLEIAVRIPTVLRSHLSHGAAEAEHRVATVGFLKFKGVTALRAEGGPEAVAAALEELIGAVQEAADEEQVTFLATDIDADGGKIILTTGAPVAQVDDEGRMLRAVRAVLDRPHGLPLKVGVNRGHTFAGEIGTDFRSTYTVMGDTVNLAARLMAAAPAEQIYVSAGVLERSRTRFATETLEPFLVKGKSEPVQAYRVEEETGTRVGRMGSRLPFRGRDGEVDLIRRAVAGLADSGSARMVVVGDTGMGKTRLVDEALDGHPSVFRLQGEANGSGNPYWALRDPLRALLGIERRSQDEMASRLTAVVSELRPSLLPLLPLLGDVMHIDLDDTEDTGAIEPRFRPERTADALADLLTTAIPGNLVVVAEDRHWLDEATITILERLVSTGGPLLLLSTTRPPADVEGTVIELGPLDPESSRAIAAAATEATPLRTHELDAVVARAGGNPLFLEELLARVRASGSAESLPDSLNAVVSAEIDTLPPLARRLLRYSSVLGRSFRRVVLDQLLAPEDMVIDDATRHALSHFVVAEGSDRWRFRHAVMHDAAYEGLSFRKRKELHARAGGVIERLAGADTAAVAEFLALHYSIAGDHAATWRYGVVAGDKAKKAFANVEAAGHYRRALESTRRQGVVRATERAEVWTSLGDVQQQAGEYVAARSSYDAALRLTGTGDPVLRADLLLRRARVKMRIGRFGAALADITRGERLVAGDDAALARLEAFRAVIWVTQERYRRAVAAGHRAEVLARSAGELEALARAYTALDWAYYMSGQPERAVYGAQALDLYRRLGQPDKASEVMINLGAWAYYEGRWDEAVDWYERASVESRRSGNEVGAVGAGMNIAEVRIGQGRPEDAAEALAEAIRTFRASGDPYGALFAEMQQGRMLLASGHPSEAAALLDELRGRAADLGQLGAALEAATHMADALTGSGRPEQALEVLAKAEAAAGEEAALLTANVARARARAYFELGRRAEASEHIRGGLAHARRSALVYDEMLLLDLLRQVEGVENADAERLASLRIQLGCRQLR